MKGLILVVTAALFPAIMNAQARNTGTARQTPDSVFARAVMLNNDQRGAEARALVDSVLRVTQPTSSVFAEGLFWRAVLSESEQVAEESHKRIVVDYPLHRRAEESLIRLAQLEMMRGNRTAAQRYLDRIVVEHPFGQQRARASYWRARLFFEENEMDRACAELGTARARLSPADVELRTEINFAAQQCANVPVPTTPPAQKQTAADTQKKSKTTDPGRKSTAAGKAATASGAATQTKSQKAAPPATMWSVQAAAFPSRANAEAFVEALKGRGYEARMVGTASPYRVWIGRFATRQEADRLAAELKARKVSTGAFVVEAEGR
jgi:cell division septation protein DedD